MLNNYFKIAFRNIVRHKAFSFLNIAGLAIGMACSIVILLWVQNELSYDRFNKNADQLYRLTDGVGDFKAAVSPAGMGEGLQTEMPEIAAVVRLSKSNKNLFEANNRKFEESNVFMADSNFLQVFSYALVEGNAAKALQRPDGILITQAIATKYFGKEDAMGKLIKKDNYSNFTVTGVLANVPANSHLQFDFIIPMSFIATSNDEVKNKSWGNFNFYTYLQINKNVDVSPAGLVKLNNRIKQIFKQHNKGMDAWFVLQPLTSIHLHSDLQIDLPGHGNIQYVNIFFIVALFIIGVACINFMNLSTARSARRAKEVGLRKVVGAGRSQLIMQFLGESLVISFLSLLVAVCLVLLLLPAFNMLSQKQLSINILDGKMIASLIAIALFTGLVSGSYPALFLSGFKPIKVLKGKMKLGGGNLLFRNGLVVVQFIISIVLLAGTAIVYKQLNFIKDKNLGFEKSNLLCMEMTGDTWNKQDALKTSLQQNPLTSSYTIISDLPGNITTGTVDVHWEGKDQKSQIVFPNINVDENFIDVFQMKILNGRGFSKAFKADSSNFVINETAVKTMGFKTQNAVGKNISFGDVKGTIIGVVEDFNFKPLQYTIEPLVLLLNRGGGTIVVRTPKGSTEASINALQKISADLNPAYPFTYNFLDKNLDNQYKGEQQMGSIFNLFAILAIFISCLGLYGLSAFMAEQRTKEIGVRKVLGASVFSIVYLLSQNFTKLIFIAMAIAIPLSWWAINSWLKSFAYRIDVSWVVYLTACLFALFIAWFTVSYESIKAAIANPIRSLRTE